MARRGEQALTKLLRLHGKRSTVLGSTCCYGSQLAAPVQHHCVQVRRMHGLANKVFGKEDRPANQSKVDRPFKHVVVPGIISPRRPIPSHIACPSYANTDGRIKPHAFEGPFEIKSAASIQGMREACALARKILDFAGTLVKVL